KFGMRSAVEFEVREERRVVQVREVRDVGSERRAMLPRDIQLEPVAIGEDRRVLTWPVRRVRTEVPIETRVDAGTDFRIALREVERRSELRDAEDIGDTGRLHRVVGIDEAGVIEGAPGDDAADPGIGGRAAVRLRMADSLHLLSRQVTRAAIVAVESFPVRVVELSDRFR